MKILVISDVHANIGALDAVWKKEHDCDAILFAGDMVDFGFYPHETVEWFRLYRDRLFAVRGNHDEWVLARRGTPVTERNRDFQTLTFAELTDGDYEFMASIPHEAAFTVGDTDFYMCHTPDELSHDVYYAEKQIASCGTKALLDERFAAKFPSASSPKRVVVYGHSHLQWVSSAGPDACVLNPGSMAYRFGSLEPVRCADYIVLEDGNVKMCHAEYDTKHLFELADTLLDPVQANYARIYYHP